MRIDAKAAERRLQTTTAVQQTGIESLIDRAAPQIKAALPAHLKNSVERFRRVALTEFRKNATLKECAPISFLGAIIQATQLGLEPGPLGHFYLVPRRVRGNWEVLGIVGYRGMIDLARRSGQITSIHAHVVREGDEFSYRLGLNPDLQHQPLRDDGDITHVYAVANLVGGGVQFEVMSRRAVDKVRESSPAGNSGPWVSHFAEMARKTVVRRLFKYLPVSIELAVAADYDERGEVGQDQGHKNWIDLGDDADEVVSDRQREVSSSIQAPEAEAAKQGTLSQKLGADFETNEKGEGN